MVNKYFVLGASVILITTFMLQYSESTGEKIDYIGIIYDIHGTSSGGFSFQLQDVDGNVMRCFSYECPVEKGLYGVCGSKSSDGNMLFISSMVYFDRIS